MSSAGNQLGRKIRYSQNSWDVINWAIGLPRWRNWHTRMLEVHVPARDWRFESSPGHINFVSLFRDYKIYIVLEVARISPLLSLREILRVLSWAFEEFGLAEEHSSLSFIPPLGRLAQLVRASRLHREGRGFESLAAHC